MKIRVQRKKETSTSITGELYVDDQFEMFTLEPARVNPVNIGHPCVPEGDYNVILTPSPHLGYITPELVNVPGRSDIRIHIGNYPKDTLGCILVGTVLSVNYVGSSKTAFDSLITLLRTAIDPLTISILDPLTTESTVAQ